MPLPHPPDMMRVRLRATLATDTVPVEEAQFGFYGQRVHVTGNPTDWAANVQYVADGIRDRWKEHILATALFSPAAVMESVKVDHLSATDGKVLDQGVALFGGDSAWAGTGPDSLPWETSLAVSLFGYERGLFTQDKARKRGRFYLPPGSTELLNGKSGQVRADQLTTLCTQIVAFLNDVQGMHLTDEPPLEQADSFNLVVMSIGTPTKPLEPTTTPVTHVYVDSEIDSQRRRQHQVGPLTTASGTVAHS